MFQALPHHRLSVSFHTESRLAKKHSPEHRERAPESLSQNNRAERLTVTSEMEYLKEQIDALQSRLDQLQDRLSEGEPTRQRSTEQPVSSASEPLYRTGESVSPDMHVMRTPLPDGESIREFFRPSPLDDSFSADVDSEFPDCQTGLNHIDLTDEERDSVAWDIRPLCSRLTVPPIHAGSIVLRVVKDRVIYHIGAEIQWRGRRSDAVAGLPHKLTRKAIQQVVKNAEALLGTSRGAPTKHSEQGTEVPTDMQQARETLVDDWNRRLHAGGYSLRLRLPGDGRVLFEDIDGPLRDRMAEYLRLTKTPVIWMRAENSQIMIQGTSSFWSDLQSSFLRD